MSLTFSKINAATDVKFISYRETLEKLALASGDSLHDVALFFKREGAYKDHAIWLNGAERTTVWDEYGVQIATLLDHTITNNEIAVCYDDWGNETGNPDTCGWWRKEFLWNISIHHGIITPDSLEAPSVQSEMPQPRNTDQQGISQERERAEQDLAYSKSQVESLKIQLSDAQRSIDDLRRLVGDQSGIALHNTHLMKIALDVQRNYWKMPDRARSKQEVIVADLIEQYGLSKPEAQAVERVACPIDRK